MNGCVRKALDAIGMLRVASSTVIKNAQRILSPSTFRNSQHHSLTCKANGTKSSELIKYFHPLDGQLAVFFQSKLETKQLYNKAMPEPPPNFPFTIEDIPGKDRIYLSRDFAGEKITAEVYAPGRIDSCVGLRVNVAKGDGDGAARLQISLAAYSHGIQISQIMFKDQRKQDYDDRMDLHRNNFWTEFVQVRGLGDPAGVFLFDYMTKRKDREDLLFFKKLNEFFLSSCDLH